MSTELFLIGDSHVCAIAEAAAYAGLNWRGGPLGTGKQLQNPFWRIESGDFVFTGPGRHEVKDRFRDLLRFDGPIVSTIGFNTHRFTLDFAAWACAQELPISHSVVSEAVFEALVADARRTALDFYSLLADHGLEVYAVTSPARVESDLIGLYQKFESRFRSLVIKTGAKILDVRGATSTGGVLKEQFACPNDEIHANADYGAVVLEELARVSKFTMLEQ